MGNSDTTLEKTLPRHCYLDAAFFEREIQAIFATQWFCVARTEQFEKAGDYQALKVAGQSVIIVRNDELQLQAFHNVCRHRGSQLVFQKDAELHHGCFKHGIRCPYHSWTYGLDGRLKITPHLGDDSAQEQSLPVDKSRLGLHPIALECWGGFIFLRLAEATPGASDQCSLLDSLGAIPERIKRYPLSKLRVGKRLEYRVAANWKVILENYNECYHCAGVHPELCKVVPAFRRNGGAGLDWDKGVPHRAGANTFTFSGTTERQPFDGLNNDEQQNHKGELVYPNLMLSLAMDHVAAFTLWPRGAELTDIVCEFLFHPDEMANTSFDPADAVEFWDLTNRQDWTICESVQRGMHSMKFEHGYYAPMEDLSLDIRDYITSHMPEAGEQ